MLKRFRHVRVSAAKIARPPPSCPLVLSGQQTPNVPGPYDENTLRTTVVKVGENYLHTLERESREDDYAGSGKCGARHEALSPPTVDSALTQTDTLSAIDTPRDDCFSTPGAVDGSLRCSSILVTPPPHRSFRFEVPRGLKMVSMMSEFAIVFHGRSFSATLQYARQKSSRNPTEHGAAPSSSTPYAVDDILAELDALDVSISAPKRLKSSRDEGRQSDSSKLSGSSQRDDARNSDSPVAFSSHERFNGAQVDSSVPSSSSRSYDVEAAAAAAANLRNLHRSLASAADAAHELSGPAGEDGAKAVEQIERRRLKYSVSDSEFDVGMSEKLFPELRRLPTLHELHYGDATSSEMDSFTYFSQKVNATDSHLLPNADIDVFEMNDSAEQHAEESDNPAYSRGKTIRTSSLDDDAFAEFDTAGEDTLGDSSDEHKSAINDSPLQNDTVEENSSVPASSSHLSVGAAGDEGEIGEPRAVDESNSSESNTSTTNHELVPVGTVAPWFVPSSGTTRLEPLPNDDVGRLLQFLMTLRNQKNSDLPEWLQGKTESSKKSSSRKQRTRESAPMMALDDVVRYLDDAPSPVIGFTECLDAPGFSSPAFLFTLYTENVSTQNAVGHIAALFGVPQKNFTTSTVNSKMSCAAMLCAVQPNTLRREHLLLLNVLRHPGFVIRTSGIVDVAEPERAAKLFTEVALWKPLHCVTLLLRRVASADRAELEHRLRAIRDVGAVFFCANREASLIRAATDTLHGFYRSAIINALQRRRAPIRLRQFLSRPNVVTATRARKTSTDSTIRQVLKNYVLEKGNWEKTVERTPYVLRRRWINALRSYVWNVMASRRLRHGGRVVIPGDLVVRKEFLEDSRSRAVDNVKAEHLHIVVDDMDAAEYTLEDVYIPFLRGAFPRELFAPDETNHPIMTESNMSKILKELHAPQLLYGMSEKAKFLLDVRSNAPMLFRRFIMRPLELQYTILEDKPPVRSVHFDASRIVDTDRYRLQRGVGEGEEGTTASSFSSPETSFMGSRLLDRDYIVNNSTFGAAVNAMSSATEDVFAVPSRQDYVVLGHARRNLEGELVSAAPQASASSLEAVDRLFSVELHVVARHGTSGVAQLLREHFILSGVEREEDSQLQHKVHRIRREIDLETPSLCAQHYCSVCYNRCHDSKESCAEFQYKKNKFHSQKIRETALQEEADTEKAMISSMPNSHFQLANGTFTDAATADLQLPSHPGLNPMGDVKLILRLELRRRTHEQLWGVKLTKSLALAGLEDVSLVSRASCTVDSSSEDAHISASDVRTVLHALQSHYAAGESELELMGAAEKEDSPHARLTALSQWMSQCHPQQRSHETIADIRSSADGVVCPPHLFRVSSTTGVDSSLPATPKRTFRLCAWRLTHVGDAPVHVRTEVAATFVKFAKEKSVRLTFSATLSQDEMRELMIGDAVQPTVDEGAGPRVADASRAVDFSQFPQHVDVTFSRQLARKASAGSSSWGIRLGQRSSDNGLTIANLNLFLGVGDSPRNDSVKAVAFPPIPADSIVSIPLVYNVHAVNGTMVQTQEDVVRVLRSSRLTSSLVLTLTRIDVQRGEEVKENEEKDAGRVGRQPVETVGGHTDDRIRADEKEDVQQVVLTRDNCSSFQCKLMSPKQHQQAIVTVAVNRRANAPKGKWGIRLQRNTLRLKGIQNNRFFTFQVFAPKQQHAVRISDALRVVERDTEDDHEERPRRMDLLPPTVFSDYAYIIAGVNNAAVHSPEELREKLAAETQNSDADSLTLQVRQYRLLNIAVQFQRDSTSQPLGVSVLSDMIIQRIAPESPMARAILEATNPSCSIRNLIRHPDARSSTDPMTVTADDGEGDGKVSEPTDSMSTQSDPAFDFSLDEDAAAMNVSSDDLSSTQRSSTRSVASSNDHIANSSVEKEPSEKSTQDAGALGPTLENLNMVDGAALPFATVQHSGLGNQPGSKDNALLATAQRQLQLNPDVHIVWRLTYSVQFGTLRTAKDVEMAMRNSTSDTWFIQQCIQDQDMQQP